ncbi:MAG: hypothetical protein IT281_04395 [Ignavibacteria bacterium]|nr:hypothetical protein [Ignavibacteria bacterium]MCC7158761.1 hypothetical protein [Ignavibacteria bacterium]
MARFLITILTGAIMLAAASGCSNNGNVLGPNQNSNVTFSITQEVSQTGSMQFMFKPGTDIKISQLISKFPAEQFADTLIFGNPNYVYSKDTTYIINRYVNVYAGQHWIFDFTGTVPGSNSQYNTSINYTVQ